MCCAAATVFNLEIWTNRGKPRSPSAPACPAIQMATTRRDGRSVTSRHNEYAPTEPANRIDEKWVSMARKRKNPTIFPAEFSLSASSSMQAAAVMKHNNSGYCRTSADNSMNTGSKQTRMKPIQPTAGPRSRVSQRKNIQQKIVPAITDGKRRNNSDVPNFRQTCRNKINRGG